MSNNTRLRINLISKEIEWEGSEEFIKKYDNTILEFFEIIKNSPIEKKDDDNATNSKSDDNSLHNFSEIKVGNSFGEFYMRFPRNISVSEKMLIAGYYLQTKNSDGLFTPSEAAALLKEQSVNVTNPNAFITSLLNTGKVFKNVGKCKVHEKGIEQVEQLLKQNS